MKRKSIATLFLIAFLVMMMLTLTACTDDEADGNKEGQDVIHEQSGDVGEIGDGERVVEYEQSFEVDLDSGEHSFSYSSEIESGGGDE